MPEFTIKGACAECLKMGFFVSHSDAHGLQVERCDNCSVFPGDDDARARVLRLASQALTHPRPRTSERSTDCGKRFEILLECLEAMAAGAESENGKYEPLNPNPKEN